MHIYQVTSKREHNIHQVYLLIITACFWEEAAIKILRDKIQKKQQERGTSVSTDTSL